MFPTLFWRKLLQFTSSFSVNWLGPWKVKVINICKNDIIRNGCTIFQHIHGIGRCIKETAMDNCDPKRLTGWLKSAHISGTIVWGPPSLLPCKVYNYRNRKTEMHPLARRSALTSKGTLIGPFRLLFPSVTLKKVKVTQCNTLWYSWMMNPVLQYP